MNKTKIGFKKVALWQGAFFVAIFFLFGNMRNIIQAGSVTDRNECIDYDGDGWGWDGEKGCRIDDSREVGCKVTGQRVFYGHGSTTPSFLFDVVGWKVEGKPASVKLYNNRGDYVDDLKIDSENGSELTHIKERDFSVSGYKIVVTNLKGETAECSFSLELNCEPTSETVINGGWGYNKKTGRGCKVNLDEEYQGETNEQGGDENEAGITNNKGCYDWDGDGWGWDGKKGCRMNGEKGEENNKPSCQIYTNTTSTQETGVTLHWYYSNNVVKATIEDIGEVTNKENWKWLKYLGSDKETYKMIVENSNGQIAACTVDIKYEEDIPLE